MLVKEATVKGRTVKVNDRLPPERRLGGYPTVEPQVTRIEKYHDDLYNVELFFGDGLTGKDLDGNQRVGFDCRIFPDGFEIVITLAQAAEFYPLAYSTLAQAAREGRLDARKAGPKTWLTTRAAIEEAIEEGRLRPRKQ